MVEKTLRRKTKSPESISKNLWNLNKNGKGYLKKLMNKKPFNIGGITKKNVKTS